MNSLDLIELSSQKLTQHGIPASTLAALADISNSDLCRYFNGVKKPLNETAQRIHQTALSLERLIQCSRAVGLPVEQGSSP